MGGGLLVHDPAFRVFRVFHVTIGRFGERLPGAAFDLVGDAPLFRYIFCVPFVGELTPRKVLESG